jgi:hypothetical protein
MKVAAIVIVRNGQHAGSQRGTPPQNRHGAENRHSAEIRHNAEIRHSAENRHSTRRSAGPAAADWTETEAERAETAMLAERNTAAAKNATGDAVADTVADTVGNIVSNDTEMTNGTVCETGAVWYARVLVESKGRRVIEDVSTSRGIRLLSIIHNGIILGSECGFFGGVCDGVSFWGRPPYSDMNGFMKLQ